MFARDPGDGTLKQPADVDGVRERNGGDGGACGDGEALDGAFDVAVSANGRNVYAIAGASDSVVIFDRDSESESSRRPAGPMAASARPTPTAPSARLSTTRSVWR